MTTAAQAAGLPSDWAEQLRACVARVATMSAEAAEAANSARYAALIVDIASEAAEALALLNRVRARAGTPPQGILLRVPGAPKIEIPLPDVHARLAQR